jgi:hypothetical protein
MDDEKRPPFLGPNYDFAAFRRDFLGGDIRWPCTALAAIGAGLLAWAGVAGEEPEGYYPAPLRGTVALTAITVACAAWVLLASANWVNWFRSRP